MPLNFIFCREYGLEPAIQGYNYGHSEANGNPLVIINKSVKPDGQTIDTRTGEILVQVKMVLYKKLINLSGFNGNDINTNIYVGKKTDLSFQNIAFDFTNDKWKIRGLTGHNLNNTKFNVYDRMKIKSILSQFLTRNVDEVFTLMYRTIATSSGLEKFLSILETVIEYKDEFLLLMKPYDVPYVDPYADLKLTNTNGTGINSGTMQNGTSETNNNTIYYVGGALVLLWFLKRKKRK
jgi:hypothetical protein